MTQPFGGGVLPAGAAAIAAALEETARHLADDVEHGEHLVAAVGASAPGIAHAHSELKRRAELLGIACAFFRELAEHPETPVDVEDFALRPLPATAVTKP